MIDVPVLVGFLALSSVSAWLAFPSVSAWLALSPVPALLGVDPVFLVLVVAFLGVFLFGFLLLRRAMLGFKQGVDEGRR